MRKLLLLFVILFALLHPTHGQYRRRVPQRPGGAPKKDKGADYYKLLGVSRPTLYDLLKQYDLQN